MDHGIYQGLRHMPAKQELDSLRQNSTVLDPISHQHQTILPHHHGSHHRTTQKQQTRCHTNHSRSWMLTSGDLPPLFHNHHRCRHSPVIHGTLVLMVWATLKDHQQEPPGYETVTGDGVKKLLKALYRLKQAGRKWYDALYGVLMDLGFCIARADPRVFIMWIGDSVLVLAVHVDNCTMTGSSGKLIAIYKAKLHKWYALTDLGPVNWLLGIQITCNCEAQTISLSQEAYIKSILVRFELSNTKPSSRPMVPSPSYLKSDSTVSANDATHMQRVPYREAIGSLMFASVAT
jgi:Reverse transcriptase (RNA-dependent DNA polymerase)